MTTWQCSYSKCFRWNVLKLWHTPLVFVSFALTLALEVVQMSNNGNTEEEQTTKEHLQHHYNVTQNLRHDKGNKVKRHHRLITLPREWILPSLPWCDSTEMCACVFVELSVDFRQAPLLMTMVWGRVGERQVLHCQTQWQRRSSFISATLLTLKVTYYVYVWKLTSAILDPSNPLIPMTPILTTSALFQS